ncbi:glycosyltransferase [Ignavibacterium sp.]|uniref:glycosyltransferase n=1 Tax=Ignavibacterium sp. TaxID=2651167 RepID=UPI00307F0B82
MKILFITYYWPPSGKASLHWPLDIITHLHNLDCEPIILTTKDETFTEKDESLLDKVDPSWVTIKSNALEPFNIYRKFIGKKKNEKLIASETISTENKSLAHRISLWIRLNLFIPDARVGWYFTAVRKAKEFIRKNKIEAIVSIGPPHTTHLVAKKLSNKFSIPFFPVFIDPWVDIVYYKNFKRSSLTKRIDKNLEKSVVDNAEKIIFVTNSMKDDYVRKYPQIKEKSFVLYWGFNEKDFEGLSLNSVNKEKELSEEKVIVHAGNIFDYQNPEMLWKEVSRRIKSGEKFKIKFIGTISPAVKQSIKKYNLEPFTEYPGFLPYEKMLLELSKADYLLVCATEKRHVPGKLFEYLRIGKPIIAFGDDNEEVQQILKDTKSGRLFRYDEEVREVFEKQFDVSPDLEAIKKFDRKNIAEGLIKILNS